MMAFGSAKSVKHREIDAAALDALIKAHHVLVVDVREVDEFAAGHIPGAINMPLSTFRANKLPEHKGKMVVLNCLGGKRSAQALDKCALAKGTVDTHLTGGFGAWKSAGLPIEP
jgi:rhodanese-related sulfurtransferase